MEKWNWEALIVDLGIPNYAKVGAKMTNLKGKEVDVRNSTDKGPSYRYFEAMKFLSVLK
jgi:hypothetical protein